MSHRAMELAMPKGSELHLAAFAVGFACLAGLLLGIGAAIAISVLVTAAGGVAEDGMLTLVGVATLAISPALGACALAARRRSAQPSDNEGMTRNGAVPRLLAEAGILVAAYQAYGAVRRLVAPDSGDAFGHAFNIIRFEQDMGIFFEPSLQGLIIDHHWLVTLFNWVYVWGYLPVISVAGLYLYLRHHDFYTRYRNAFLLSGAVGLVIFATFPVAPPRMFPGFGFIDTVRTNSAVYRSFEGSGLVNEFAAVPSFHFGWILLVGLALIQTNHHIALRAAGVLLPLLMLAAIIVTANHYFIDAIIGGAIVLLALAAVRMAERWSLPEARERLLHRAPGEPVMRS